MLTQRSVIVHRILNPPSNNGRALRQFYSRNYSSPSSIPTEPKAMTQTPTESTTATSETQKLQDNSQMTAHSYVYYETYRTSGFHPDVYNAPAQPKSVKKLPNADLATKKIVAEHTCPITTYNHAYYKEFSIAGFNSIRTSPPAQPEPANQMANKPAEGLGKGPTNKPAGEHTSIGHEISRAEALAIATAYIPIIQIQETKKNQDRSLLDHDIETCAQTIEELEFETLGITGFQRTHDETGDDELKTEVDGGKVDEQSVQSGDGDAGSV